MRVDKRSFRSLVLSPLVAFGVVALVSAVPADEHFSATAVNLDAGGTGRVTTEVEITVTRWSTDLERTSLSTALQEGGSEALLDKLRHFSPVGTMAALGSVGINVQFARRSIAASGTERVLLITDRPIGVWETMNAGRSLEYPFTVIEMRIGPDGKGEGKASLAAKVIYDPGTKEIELEDYSIQPVLLRNVERSK